MRICALIPNTIIANPALPNRTRARGKFALKARDINKRQKQIAPPYTIARLFSLSLKAASMAEPEAAPIPCTAIMAEYPPSPRWKYAEIMGKSVETDHANRLKAPTSVVTLRTAWLRQI